MISDQLYALAFEYKKTKLWRMLWDVQVFAVKLSDGRIGYISIMGGGGSHCALGLYIGQAGLDSLRCIAEADQFRMSPFEFHENIIRQDCLQCAFEGKEELSKEELEEARAYARANGIRISGKNAYPQFVRYKPSCLPWPLQTQQEQEDLCEALSAAIHMAKLLEGHRPQDLGIQRIDGGADEIVLLELQDGAYAVSKIKALPRQPMVWPEPSNCNEIGLASLKKIRKSGTYECEIIQFPDPVQNGPGEAPCFPFVFLAVNADMNFVLPVSPVKSYLDAPEELLNFFIDALRKEGMCPKELLVRDERTYAFAKGFCAKLKIPISIEKDLPALDEVEMDFVRHFSMSEEEELAEFVSLIGEMMEDGIGLGELPPEITEQLEQVLQREDMPEDILDQVEEILYRGTQGRPRLAKSDFKTVKPKSGQSYVISVSLGTGCYRHIQISGKSSLWRLHSAIIQAFGFDDDHAHAFFMDNKRWSKRDAYYASFLENGCRTTDSCTLDKAGLCKGKKFLYLFDFGDEWTFQCKVLKVVEEATDQPVVIKSKGDAPEQYPSWEDE